MAFVRNTISAALIGVVSLWSTGAQAVAYTDEATFQANAGAFVLEDFEGLGPHGTSVPDLPALGVDLLPLVGGADPRVVQPALIGGTVQSGSFVLTNNANDFLPANGSLNIVPINGTDIITAVGLWNVSGDDTMNVIFYDALDVVMESISLPNGAPAFGGIVNSAGASRVEIAFGGIGNGWITIDDLQVTVQADAVPEPGAFAIFGIGIAALAMVRRRQQKKAPRGL